MNGNVGDKYHEDAQMLIVTKVCKRNILFTGNEHPTRTQWIEGHQIMWPT
jgi:hypothetical protein